MENDNPTFVAEPIWVTDHNNPAFMSPEVFASAMVNTGKCPKTPNGLLNGSLAICTADHVMICNLSLASKIVPRAVFLPGSPEKMIYSPRLNRIVVASSVREKKLDAGHVLSWTRPQLDFLDPDSNNPFPFEFKSDETSHTLVETEVPRLRGAAGEKVTALLEWTFKFGEMSYTFIVLATQTPYVSDKDSRLRGYLHFLRARFSQKYPEEVESVAKHRLAFEEPVRSCCPYGDSGLLVTYGKTVRIVVLDQQTRHFLPGPEFALETEATSVSEEKGFIYIMTSRSSLLVLAEQGQGSGQLRLLAQAGCDKAGLDHVQFGSLPVMLTSHRGGNIVGYAKRDRYHPALRLLDLVFVANLTSSVRYLRDLPPAHSKVQACGVALDGTVFEFTALEERQWRLLKFLQNLYMADNTTEFRGNKPIDLFSDNIGKKENLQVDGDILSKLVNRGSSYLRCKIGSPVVKDGEDSVMEEVEGVQLLTTRFEELARPLFSNSKDPDLCRTVMAWVRDLVQVR
ncbi:hypothetical protein KEM56_003996 [Ascosphaera pollenicola]|nr:hypothetical protein KEM56_003996 [Ascosphaera pollenicola]